MVYCSWSCINYIICVKIFPVLFKFYLSYLMQDAAMFKVSTGNIPPIPETLSSEGKDFLRCCFQRDPAERPSASMLLKHPFLKNLEPSAAMLQEHRFLKNSEQLDVPFFNPALNRKELTVNINVMPFIVAKLLFLLYFIVH